MVIIALIFWFFGTFIVLAIVEISFDFVRALIRNPEARHILIKHSDRVTR